MKIQQVNQHPDFLEGTDYQICPHCVKATRKSHGLCDKCGSNTTVWKNCECDNCMERNK